MKIKMNVGKEMDFNRKKKLLRFILWFFLGNTGLFWLIGTRYLFITLSSKSLFFTSFYTCTSMFEKACVLLFTFSSYLGHFALLAFFPCLLLMPLVLVNKRCLIFLSAISIWSMCAIALIADNIIFSLFHFHINFIILKIIFNNEYGLFNFLELSSLEVSIIIATSLGILLIEIGLAFFIWNKIILAERWFFGKKMIAVLLGCARLLGPRQ
jgi:uncharacterized protein